MASSGITTEQIEQMAARMAEAIPDLDCPECCECGWTFQYVERSAQVYQEEYEWAVLFQALIQHRRRGGRSGG